MNDLERRLVDLGGHLDAPSGDGLAASVTARLAEAPRRRPTRRWVAAAAALLFGAAVATPAVAGWLGTDEVAIRQGPPPSSAPVPPPSTPTTAPGLDLGRRVTMDEAAAAAGFRPIVPAALGEPDEVWLDDRTSTPLVWLRWDDEGVLLTEVAGDVPGHPVLTKFAGDARVESVPVGRRPGWWIDGVHEVVIADPDGGLIPQRLRTADRTLLVEMGSFTVRIEASGGLDDAMRIARTLPGT